MPTEFEKVAGFCGECGSVLPPLRETGGLTCYTCMKTFNPEMLIDQSDHVQVPPKRIKAKVMMKDLSLRENVQSVVMKKCLMPLCNYVQQMKAKQCFTLAQNVNIKRVKTHNLLACVI
ncbi:hypothetical protein GWI33_022391 [Rhynchophorus ferrugineus]|uniref:Uncharacterized protein n=1 Tax=Rhynchophorus ferrugineus TaxID=354439 RepID=A0A834IQS2_RHYFE|nr:hypothetical protein GWI33_022391 [Rhynchophorus ferrugineus]